MSETQSNSNALLHVYSPPFWHEEAVIVGNSEALTGLRDALTELIERGEGGVSRVFFHADGEGYELRVVLQEDESAWRKYWLPYTDEMCQGSSAEDAVMP